MVPTTVRSRLDKERPSKVPSAAVESTRLLLFRDTGLI